MRESAADSLRFEMEAPPEVPSGSPVALKLRLRNTGHTAAVLYLKGRTIAFDLLVTRPSGDTVWRRLSGNPMQEIVQVRRLEPGAELLLEDEWDQQDRDGRVVPPGDYQVRGMLFTDRPEPWVTDPVRLRIVPSRRSG